MPGGPGHTRLGLGDLKQIPSPPPELGTLGKWSEGGRMGWGRPQLGCGLRQPDLIEDSRVNPILRQGGWPLYLPGHSGTSCGLSLEGREWGMCPPSPAPRLKSLLSASGDCSEWGGGERQRTEGPPGRAAASNKSLHVWEGRGTDVKDGGSCFATLNIQEATFTVFALYFSTSLSTGYRSLCPT